MDELLKDFVRRLLRTETLAALAGVALYLTGRVETIEEGVIAAGGLVALILGRSWVKGRNGS